VLAPGATYQVTNAQDPYGAPLSTGVYAGGVLSFPTAGLAPAQPLVAPGGLTAGEHTGTAFNVYVLTTAVCP
jgi:hypothetical protein